MCKINKKFKIKSRSNTNFKITMRQRKQTKLYFFDNDKMIEIFEYLKIHTVNKIRKIQTCLSKTFMY